MTGNAPVTLASNELPLAHDIVRITPKLYSISKLLTGANWPDIGGFRRM